MAVSSIMAFRLLVPPSITVGSIHTRSTGARMRLTAVRQCARTHFRVNQEIITKHLALKLLHKFKLRISGKT